MVYVRGTFLLSHDSATPLTISELLGALVLALVIAVLLILVAQIVFALNQGAKMGQPNETTVEEAAEELETETAND
jgi:hypothetical protein